MKFLHRARMFVLNAASMWHTRKWTVSGTTLSCKHYAKLACVEDGVSRSPAWQCANSGCCLQVPYLGRYAMHSGVERRANGQGVVQFAHGNGQASQYAIKFYTHFDIFARERDLYMEPVLREMMPATQEIIGNEDAAIRMPDGFVHVFPPCIVIEKGESLDVWATRERHDCVTILQVLCHIAERLEVLHAAGWAHRDIKPGNVLRRPEHHRWTLINSAPPRA
jgi:hypothetical protein